MACRRFDGDRRPTGVGARELATSIFGGTLVLATLAPLVAVYYQRSSMAGLPLALGSVFVALATASLLFGRAVARRLSERPGRTASLFAAGVLVTLFLAALLQCVALVNSRRPSRRSRIRSASCPAAEHPLFRSGFSVRTDARSVTAPAARSVVVNVALRPVLRARAPSPLGVRLWHQVRAPPVMC